jgi:hypothetical protein
VAKILSMPERFQNERIYISGMAVTQLDILEAFKKATGPEKEWDVSHRTAESLRQQGNDKLAKNDFGGVFDVIAASLFEVDNGSYYSKNVPVMNDVLGVEDDLYQSVDEYVRSQSGKE